MTQESLLLPALTISDCAKFHTVGPIINLLEGVLKNAGSETVRKPPETRSNLLHLTPFKWVENIVHLLQYGLNQKFPVETFQSDFKLVCPQLVIKLDFRLATTFYSPHLSGDKL